MIIIDDGSPDGTLEVAKRLQELYGEKKIVKFGFLLKMTQSYNFF